MIKIKIEHAGFTWKPAGHWAYAEDDNGEVVERYEQEEIDIPDGSKFVINRDDMGRVSAYILCDVDT